MMKRFFWLSLVLLSGLLMGGSFLSCVGDARQGNDDDDSGAGGTAAGNPFGGSLGAGGDITPDVIGDLTGTVLAPEGTIPISGALVYLTSDTPEPIPQQVFCDKCIELPPDVPYTLSAADGSFTLDTYYSGELNLVVQKGAFRRVRSITVSAGSQSVDPSFTTLPMATDAAAGDFIPKMAVLDGIYDDIEDSLAKLGLGQVDSFGDLISGTESFDLFDGSARNNFLTDYSQLSQYHIVYFPCATSWPDNNLSDPTVIDNLINYMNAGGRLYVTDYSYDVLRRARAEPITWEGDNGSFGSAESGYYDAPATAADPDLAAWLSAQGINGFTAEANWTIISSVNNYDAPDENGANMTFTPTTWVTGDVPGSGNRPLTVSYQHGCGRALFSTYHTESGSDTLLVQERALLYIILEVAVCIGDIAPPK